MKPREQDKAASAREKSGTIASQTQKPSSFKVCFFWTGLILSYFIFVHEARHVERRQSLETCAAALRAFFLFQRALGFSAFDC